MCGCGSSDEGPSAPRPIGTNECRAEGATCPSRCLPVMATRIDNVNRCIQDELVTCAINAARPRTWACFVRKSTGEVFGSFAWALQEPEFYDYRPCTKEEDAEYDPITWSLNRCNKLDAG